MEHYIQYQKCDNNFDWKKEPFIYTKRDLKCSQGDIIWLIAGKKIDNKTSYYLVKKFTFTEKKREKDRIYYCGNEKNLIYKDKTIEITTRDWFDELFSKLGNGRRGFSKLPPEFIEHLEKEISG